LSSIKQLFLGGSSGGYQIERSLRFNSADSAYLNRTFGTPTDNKKWTFSAWIKVSNISSGINRTIFSGDANDGGTNFCFIRYNSLNQIDFRNMVSGVDKCFVNTTAVFRDPSAYFHLQFVFDSNNATQANRQILYINGISVGLTGTLSTSSDACSLNVNGRGHRIGELQFSTSPFDGYMTEVNFIDGQALTPSSFGETDSATGVWKPKKFSGTYGTNGFYLNFSDNSNTTSTTLGKDSSGNGNNWTPNLFSVTAGAGNDSLVDTPTSYGTDTGVGGEVRGNYATQNALVQTSNLSLSNGNLTITGSGSYSTTPATLGMSSGKWYWEYTCTTYSASGDTHYGIGTGAFNIYQNTWAGNTAAGWVYVASNGSKYNNGTSGSYGASFTSGNIIGVAFDADAGTLVFYKDGVSQGTAYTGLTSGPYFPIATVGTSNVTNANFGQRPFAYTAPSGFKALCTQNLPTPTIGATSTTQADNYFDIDVYTGIAGTYTKTGLGFQPDLIWGKGSNAAVGHRLVDAVRGGTLKLATNLTDAESTDVAAYTFTSDGYSIPGGVNHNNSTGTTYAAWLWNAGGSNQTISVGQYATSPANVPSIASTVRANTTAGFSIVKTTGTGSAGTIGHGLGTAPRFIFGRNYSDAGGSNWPVYHASVGANNIGWINLTNAFTTSAATAYWNDTAPTSSVFSVGTNSNTNQSGASHIFYCFAPVAGYSAFGSYTGNGSTDGPFVFLGFRPRFIMIKASSSTGDWVMEDVARSPYNVSTNYLVANASTAEQTGQLIDFVSNGFKIRVAVSGAMNSSGVTYIYAAFAENPFKYSLAR
jgi:hypothetical protein